MATIKRIIFVLPYLNVNTTSAERFKSFIKAAERIKSIETEVVVFDYGVKRSYFSGLSVENVDNFYPNSLNIVKVKFNFIQKLAFKSLNNGLIYIWRLFQLFHLILYRRDVFYPGVIEQEQTISNGDTIVFCSGSHFSLFETSKDLALAINAKLVLDYRDPWTFGYTALDGFAFVQKLKVWAGRTKELDLLNHAEIVTTVSTSIKDFFPKKVQSKILLIPNGSIFTKDEISPVAIPKNFNLVYAGTIYKEQLVEENFFKVFKEFLRDKNQTLINLQFLGAGDNFQLDYMLSKFRLKGVTTITPRLEREEFLDLMNNASAFLHLRYGNNQKVISSKQAEYLTFRKPIILPVSDNGDISQSIKQYQAGFVCDSDEDILNCLELLWSKFVKNETFWLENNEEQLKFFSREKIADGFIENLLNPPSSS